MPRLIAFDLPNLITRCWHTPQAYKDDLGQTAHAVSGTLNTILRVLRAEPGATHLLIAKDSPDNLKKAKYASYKATRKVRDPDIRRQELLAERLFTSAEWPVFEFPGYEADDILASVALLMPTTVVSGDKDLLALASDTTVVRLLRSGPQPDLRCGPQECFDILGVRPDQVVDYKAIAGDASDHISGIPKLGPKGAVALLTAYGHLETVYKPEILAGITPETLRLRLTEHRQEARESYDLARMKTNLPISLENLPAIEDLFTPLAEAAAAMCNLTGLASRLSTPPFTKREI